MPDDVDELAEESQRHRRGHFARAFSRLIRKKIAVAAMVIIAIIWLSGIFAAPLSTFVTGYEYTAQDYTAFREPPSLEHWAGTDRAGRDVFTRLLWGIQNTVILTFVGMFSGGLVIGITLGLVSGYFGGKVDGFVMRIGEIAASFPASCSSSSSPRRCVREYLKPCAGSRTTPSLTASCVPAWWITW